MTKMLILILKIEMQNKDRGWDGFWEYSDLSNHDSLPL
jgi:hypothetical protein